MPSCGRLTTGSFPPGPNNRRAAYLSSRLTPAESYWSGYSTQDTKCPTVPRPSGSYSLGYVPKTRRKSANSAKCRKAFFTAGSSSRPKKSR